MWNAFQRYRALDPQARALFRQALLLLPWTALSLRFRGFKKTQSLLESRLATRVSLNSDSSLETVQRTCRMVRAAARYGVVQPSCLADSLTVWYLLQKQHVPANLKIGVRKQAHKFEAHAWVEYQGSAVNQPADQHKHYAAFDAAFSGLSGDGQ